jgi:hypothetical protein
MPFQLDHRDDTRRRIRFTAIHPLRLSEVIVELEGLVAAGLWQYGLIIDLRRGILVPADRNPLREQIAAMAATYGPHGPMAMVTKNATDVANAQVYVIQSRTEMIQVFWDIEDANRWLDSRQPENPSLGSQP